MRVRSSIIHLILLCALSVAGCGVYTFNPRGESSVGTIAVEPFENKTTEYGLSDRLTDVIVDAFIIDGTITVVPLASAEAVLVGVLTKYERVAERFDENDQVETYKVIMDFEIAFRNPEDNTDIWKENMRHEGTYDALDEIEEDGQNHAVGRLVEAIINKTTKSW